MWRVAFLILFCSSVAQAQEPEAWIRDGLAAQVGAGLKHGGGVGGALEYQVKINDWLRITPFAGLGFSVGGSDDYRDAYYWLTGALGANVELGYAHRLVAGPQVFVARNVRQGPDAAIERMQMLGTSLAAGYKGTASFGLLWELSAGVAWVPDPFDEAKGFAVRPALSLGVDKF